MSEMRILSLQNGRLERMITRMNDETVKRYSLAEIALLFIFMVGLLLAHVLVKVRHRIELAEPVTLAGSGLSVSMPSGTGWEYETSWRYESDSSMVLVGQHQIGRQRKASIRWRYAICSPGRSAEEILQHRAEESGSRINSIKALDGPVSMYYAVIYPEGSDYSFYLGIVPLDFGRHLELQVFVYQQFDLAYGENLFQTLAGGIDYQPSPQLQAGRELMDAFWEAIQAGSLRLDGPAENAFLLKSTTNQPIGYDYYNISSIENDQVIRYQLRAQHYERRFTHMETTLLFDGAQQRFTWKSTLQQAGAGRPRQYTLIQGADGLIDISTDFEADRQLACNRLLLPEVLLPHCGALLLENGQPRSLIIDVLSATGLVVPTILEKADIQTASAESDQITFMIKVDFLNNPFLYEELYFNRNKDLIGRLDRRPSATLLWEPATLNQLEKIFGDNFKPLNENVAVMQ